MMTARTRRSVTAAARAASSAGAGTTAKLLARANTSAALTCSFSVTITGSGMSGGSLQHRAAAVLDEQSVEAARQEAKALTDAPLQFLSVHRHHMNAGRNALSPASRQNLLLRGQHLRMLQLARQRHRSGKVIRPNEGGVKAGRGQNRVGIGYRFVMFKHHHHQDFL